MLTRGLLSNKIKQETDRIVELEEKLKNLRNSPKYIFIKEAASGKFGAFAQMQAATDLAKIRNAMMEVERQIADRKRELDAVREEVL